MQTRYVNIQFYLCVHTRRNTKRLHFEKCLYIIKYRLHGTTNKRYFIMHLQLKLVWSKIFTCQQREVDCKHH